MHREQPDHAKVFAAHAVHARVAPLEIDANRVLAEQLCALERRESSLIERREPHLPAPTVDVRRKPATCAAEQREETLRTRLACDGEVDAAHRAAREQAPTVRFIEDEVVARRGGPCRRDRRRRCRASTAEAEAFIAAGPQA